MASIFDKWNKSVDAEQMKKEIADAEKNGVGYKEVPNGDYVVKAEKMEIKESQKGNPMLSVQFRITDGEFAKSCLFMNQVINKPFQIAIANEFLRSLDTGIDIAFDGNYEHYNDLILDVHEAAAKDKLEYLLKVTESKGYKRFEVKEVYAN